MLVTTIIGYSLFYFLRKNLSLAMPGLAQDYGITKTTLGLFLTLHGVVYGLGKFVNGPLSDRCNSRRFLWRRTVAGHPVQRRVRVRAGAREAFCGRRGRGRVDDGARGGARRRLGGERVFPVDGQSANVCG
jgi:MFS family permease